MTAVPFLIALLDGPPMAAGPMPKVPGVTAKSLVATGWGLERDIKDLLIKLFVN
jgi:hypothetical protein